MQYGSGLELPRSAGNLCNCNALADKDNLRGVTRAINGGYIGLASRADWLAKTKHVWGT
jgi:predicted chitinase